MILFSKFKKQIVCSRHTLANRIKEEKSLYANFPLIMDALIEKESAMKEGIQLGELIQERKIVANLGKELFKQIMDWEKESILKMYSSDCIKIAEIEEQKRVHQEIKNANATKDLSKLYFMHFFKLEDVVYNNVLFEKLKLVRNQTLHSDMPLLGSFRFITMPDTALGKLLNIIKPIGRDKSEINIYELQK
nr:hypothetical protein [Bacteroidota bacterium]